ncbi:unnamed protein product [Brassica rapa subsp. trilocularis]
MFIRQPWNRGVMLTDWISTYPVGHSTDDFSNCFYLPVKEIHERYTFWLNSSVAINALINDGTPLFTRFVIRHLPLLILCDLRV